MKSVNGFKHSNSVPADGSNTHTCTRVHTQQALQPPCALKRKAISQHPSLCFATTERPSKHLHLWGDAARDNGSGALPAAAHPGSVAVGQVRASPLGLSCSWKRSRWGGLKPLEISGLYRLHLKPCSDLSEPSCTGIRQVFHTKVLERLKKNTSGLNATCWHVVLSYGFRHLSSEVCVFTTPADWDINYPRSPDHRLVVKMKGITNIKSCGLDILITHSWVGAAKQ